MAEDQTTNKLWVKLSQYGEGNIFHVYPKLLSEILLQEDAARQEGDFSEAEKLVLPSDKEWRLQQYFLLVSMQKEAETDTQESVTTRLTHLEEEGKVKLRSVSVEEPPEEWVPWNMGLQIKNPNTPPPVHVNTTPGPAWDISKVLKAAHLLSKPPIAVEFVDEQEMRCVYSLIYDVFRYKVILNQAIDDIAFFGDYPNYVNLRNVIWLFLMELARRKWSARPRNEIDRAQQLLDDAGSPFKEIENIVWDQRVHFAAAIARIRIKNRAYSLCELLPPHLREEKVSASINKEAVTGWVNTFKTKKIATLVKRLHELGYSYSGSKQLCAGEYRFDKVCPRFITLRPPPGSSVGQLDLVKNGVIVIQEREFCEGASTLCRALRTHALCGVVAQTHASSPRCSAYLAAQLRELAAVLRASTPAAPVTPQLGKLCVFGAGDKASNYAGALRDLGIEASDLPHTSATVWVLSEPVYADTPIVTSALDGVVAVLATPPNSYSSVTDPIDLVCGRGGDLAMLEILTESNLDDGGAARVQGILQEQKRTLRTLMAKPQIQLILYETHSALEAENGAQVVRAVAEANRLAREKHRLLRRRNKSHKISEALEPTITESIESIDNTINEKFNQKEDLVTDALKGRSTRPASCKTRPQSGASSSGVSRPTSGLSRRISTSDKSKRPSSNGILKKKTEGSVSDNRPGTTKARPIPALGAMEDGEIQDPDKDNPDVFVPECDLFEVGKLPTLGNGLDIKYILDRDGCYLSLIQRKEFTRLDAKYMIQVAEERGLFGGATEARAVVQRRKRNEHTATKRRKRKHSGFEVGRVSAPTYASLVRSQTRRGSAPANDSAGDKRDAASVDLVCICERHAKRQAAACSYTSSACTCDAKHRRSWPRRGSAAPPASPRACSPPSPPCRLPFPLAVHEVTLFRTMSHPPYSQIIT